MHHSSAEPFAHLDTSTSASCQRYHRLHWTLTNRHSCLAAHRTCLLHVPLNRNSTYSPLRRNGSQKASQCPPGCPLYCHNHRTSRPIHRTNLHSVVGLVHRTRNWS